MKNKKKSNVLKKMLYVAIIVYVIITFANQQKTLNSYKNTTKNRAERQSSVDERHAKFEGFLIER